MMISISIDFVVDVAYYDSGGVFVNKQKIGRNLKTVREKAGLTQREFAQELGVASAAYNAYENGVNPIPVQVLHMLHERFYVSIDWLMGFSSLPHGTILRTRADKIQIFYLLDNNRIIDIQSSRDIQDDGVENSLFVAVRDEKVCEFAREFAQIKKLHKDGTINDDLYQLWLAQQFEMVTLKDSDEDVTDDTAKRD